MQIHLPNWRQKNNLEIIALFEVFGEVTILPNQTIINELRKLEIATLELLEDRSFTSVYRIKQTGVVYQIDCEEGRVFQFNDYEDYQNEKGIDEPVTIYLKKEPVFIIYKEDGKSFIKRKKYPRFKAEITFGELSDLGNIQWMDPIENPLEIAKMRRKAGEFIVKQTKY